MTSSYVAISEILTNEIGSIKKECFETSGPVRKEWGLQLVRISAILNIDARVLPEMHRDAMDKMDDFFRGSKE